MLSWPHDTFVLFGTFIYIMHVTCLTVTVMKHIKQTGNQFLLSV